MPLTRPQRFIYFLIDGRRTISDLVRCTRKNIQEVEWILSELQEQNLISIVGIWLNVGAQFMAPVPHAE